MTVIDISENMIDYAQKFHAHPKNSYQVNNFAEIGLE